MSPIAFVMTTGSPVERLLFGYFRVGHGIKSPPRPLDKIHRLRQPSAWPLQARWRASKSGPPASTGASLGLRWIEIDNERLRDDLAVEFLCSILGAKDRN
jgi:hypothetical protein